MIPGYLFDPGRRYWHRPEGGSIPYTDGDDAERYLLDTLRNARDVSSVSSELPAAIRDWPSEYHLSPERQNLIRFLESGPDCRILELGCGCGAITRFLGESGANIVAVEGSALRAEIAAERCRDLTNVSIFCDNIVDFRSEGKFDYVTLIGVLEYAPLFVAGKDPISTVLEHARSFLKEGGALILAIENQLGLKYFNGCCEDHVGIPFYGIHGLYGRNDPVTFGRRTIADKLRQAGFPSQAFYYPFPDYKLPRVILAEAACTALDFDPASLLAGFDSDDCSPHRNATFFEPLAWRSIAANGLLPELANSFLILASIGKAFTTTCIDRSALAYSYAAKRLPRYATETIFKRRDAGDLVVEKRSLCADGGETAPALLDGTLHYHPAAQAEYVSGMLYITELQQSLLARGESVETIAAWAEDWLSLLLAHASHDKGKWFLPGDWLDAIPQNYVRTTDASLRRIDIEWRWSRPIPLAWIIIRGLFNAFAASPSSPAFADLSLQEVIRKIAAKKDIALDEEVFRQVTEFESALRKIVFDDRDFNKTFKHYLAQPAVQLAKPSKRERLIRQNALLEKEIHRVKSTVSWQITKPLRFLAFLWRKIYPDTKA